MLIAGSVLSLVFSGFAVDGFMKPVHDEDENDAHMDDDLDAEAGGDSDAGTGLSDLLFPEGSETDTESNIEEIAGQDVSTDEANPEADSFTMAAIDTEPSADAAAGLSANADIDGMVDVDEITALHNGTDVAYVDGFDPHTDSLVLEFDGTTDDRPDIDIDHTAEVDAAVVTANGTPVALIEGGQDMQPENVRIVMSGIEIADTPANSEPADATDTTGAVDLPGTDVPSAHDDWPTDPSGTSLADSPDFVEDAEMAGSVTDFNPIEDRIEVLYDPDLNPDPVVQVLDFADGTGADIVLNGEVILSVTGAQGLDPNMIELSSVA